MKNSNYISLKNKITVNFISVTVYCLIEYIDSSGDNNVIIINNLIKLLLGPKKRNKKKSLELLLKN